MLAGVAAWPIMEALIVLQARFPSYLVFSAVSGAAFGAVFGGFFGVIDGTIAGNRRRAPAGGAIGAVVAAVGGAAGFVLGQGALFLVGETLGGVGGELGRWARPVARALGWAVLGACVALADGARARSGFKAVMGLTGGLVGGLLGGVVLELATQSMRPAWARPVGLVLLGGMVAAFYMLVEHRFSYGSLRLLNGPYKGKEFIVNTKSLTFGSARTDDIYLPEYRGVGPRELTVKVERGELVAYAAGDGNSMINDTAVPIEGSPPLKFEDVIQVGSAKLLFLALT
jgi:MFS family permease